MPPKLDLDKVVLPPANAVAKSPVTSLLAHM